jgi:TP901 family phage tail tape measure protein
MASDSIIVVATLKAVDLVSEVLDKVSASFGLASDAAQTAADAAAAAGAEFDSSLLQTASGADAVQLAAAKAATAQEQLAAATREQAAAEQSLLDVRAAIATEEELAQAAYNVATAQHLAAEATKELEAAQGVVATLKEEEASADAVAAAMAQLAEAEKVAATFTDEFSAATERQNALLTESDAAAAADRLAAAQRTAASATRDNAAAQDQLKVASLTAAAAQGDEAAKAELAAMSNTKNAEASDVAAASNDKNAASTEKVKNAAFIGAAVVAGIGYESVKSAMSFQTLTTRLVTTANESKSALGQVQNGILAISNQTGVSADSLAQSMYVVESAGYHGAAGLQVLQAATEGAATEGANFSDVANAVTDILKDYHKSSSDAANVTSQLTEAVSVGKANFQTMSSAMGNVLPIAASVGLKFNDVAGTLAEMTNHGITAQRASQNLATAIRSLEKPSATMQSEFKKVGITTDELNQHLATQGLGGTLEWLSKTAAAQAPKLGQTYTGALGNLMGTAAGLNVALETTGKNAQGTADGIALIGNATADSNGNVKGFSDLQQTTAFRLNQAKQAIQNAGIALGTELLPLVTKAANEVTKVVTAITGWIEKHQKLVVTIVEVVGSLLLVFGAIKMVTSVIDILRGAMTLLAENPWVAAITILILALVYLYTHVKAVRDILNDLGHYLAVAFKAVWKAVGDVIDWFSKNVLPLIVAGIKAIFDWFEAHKQDFVDAWNKLVHLVQEAVQWFDDNVISWIRERITEFTAWWKSHSQEISDVWKVVWTIIEFAVKVWWDGYMKPTLSIIASTWKVVWGAIKDTVKLVWGLISGIVTTVMHIIMNTIGVILDLITGKWGKAWQDVKKLVTQGLNDVKNIIVNLASNFGSLLYDAGKNVIQGLINGISSMIGGIGNVMGSITGAISSFLPHSPAKVGPLSGSGSPDIAGRKLGQMVASGLSSSAPEITSAAMKATAAAQNALKKGQQSLAVGSASFLAAGFTTGALGAGGATAGAGVTYHIDVHDNTVMSDRDTDMLVQKIQKRIATVTLPSGGYRSRF